MKMFQVICKRGNRKHTIGDYLGKNHARKVAKTAKTARPGYRVEIVQYKLETSIVK